MYDEISGQRSTADLSPTFLKRRNFYRIDRILKRFNRMGLKNRVAGSLQGCWRGCGRVQEPFIFCLPVVSHAPERACSTTG